MKNVLLLSLVLMLTASLAVAAEPGRVGLFGSTTPTGTNGVDNCGITDSASGLLAIYVCHVGSDGSTASQFSAPVPSCFVGSFLSDTAVFPVTVGSSQAGVGIGYGVCQTSTALHVLTINVFAQGLTPPCCIWPVLPDPREEPPVLVMTDCDFNLLPVGGQSGIVNPDGTCPCSEIIPVQESTWGKIKSLYQ